MGSMWAVYVCGSCSVVFFHALSVPRAGLLAHDGPTAGGETLIPSSLSIRVN